MAYVLEPADGPPPGGDGRSLAMLAYALLFFSIFFAGAPALIAVALAYSQKSKATPLRAHYRFQIGLFWAGFFVALVAGLLGFTGVILALGDILAAGSESASNGFRRFVLHGRGADTLLMASGAVLIALDAVLIMGCSAFGFIKLASGQSLSKSAA